MVLPDTENSEPDYLKEHEVELVKVYSDFYNNSHNVKKDSIYYNRKVMFYTIAKCNTKTKEQMCEMWIMNFLGNFFLMNFYERYQQQFSPGDFLKVVWEEIKKKKVFNELWFYANDLFDNKTEPRDVYKILNKESYEFFEILINE
jgi:rhamnogalacturonyl hydrolase YesR